MQENRQKKTVFLAHVRLLKKNYGLFLRLLTLHCFFLTLRTVFLCIIPYVYICFYYFLILCFCFHLLFLILLATKHILQFTMFHKISLQAARNVTEYEILHSPRWRKNVNALIFSCYKVWVFPLSSLSTYFFLVFAYGIPEKWDPGNPASVNGCNT